MARLGAHRVASLAAHRMALYGCPITPWERGLNENTNGLIRQYFPKNRDFTTITQQEIDHVMQRLNNRPKKCLGIKTPNQVLFGIKPDVALVS